MKRILPVLAFLLTLPAQAAPLHLCGWIDNPTPANVDLTDASGNWVIGVQGGHQADGDVDYQSSDDEQVYTNGNHGYFCGCIKADVNQAERTVLKIHSSKAKKLADCLQDKKLPQDYRPRHLVHSNGKAYTECQDENEQQVRFKGRESCVNKAGDYYFISDAP